MTIVEATRQLRKLLDGRPVLNLTAEYRVTKGLPLAPPEMVFGMLEYWKGVVAKEKKNERRKS